MSFTIIVKSNFSTGTCISKTRYVSMSVEERLIYTKHLKHPLKRDIGETML